MRLAPSYIWTAALFACAIGFGSMARAGWTDCQKQPTPDCLLEEAFRGNGGPLTGKDRIDVMIAGGVLAHPDWANSADIAEAQRLAQSTTDVTGHYYALLAIPWLVAAHQTQQAIDLVAALKSARQSISINKLVKDLVKAGDVETALALPDRMQPPPDPTALPQIRTMVVVAATKALAEAGKTDQALMLIADQRYLDAATIADLQTSVGQAFAKRGDTKLAESVYDQALRTLESARSHTIGAAADMQVRFASIRVLALRGKLDDVDAALRAMRSSLEDASLRYMRGQGYQQVVAALLEAKQHEAALILAKSLAPDDTRDALFLTIGGWEASNGRLTDARALLASMSSTQETFARTALLRTVAVYCARQGDVTSALALAGELRNTQQRQGTLFAIAHVLPH